MPAPRRPSPIPDQLKTELEKTAGTSTESNPFGIPQYSTTQDYDPEVLIHDVRPDLNESPGPHGQRNS